MFGTHPICHGKKAGYRYAITCVISCDNMAAALLSIEIHGRPTNRFGHFKVIGLSHVIGVPNNFFTTT